MSEMRHGTSQSVIVTFWRLIGVTTPLLSVPKFLERGAFLMFSSDTHTRYITIQRLLLRRTGVLKSLRRRSVTIKDIASCSVLHKPGVCVKEDEISLFSDAFLRSSSFFFFFERAYSYGYPVFITNTFLEILSTPLFQLARLEEQKFRLLLIALTWGIYRFLLLFSFYYTTFPFPFFFPFFFFFFS